MDDKTDEDSPRNEDGYFALFLAFKGNTTAHGIPHVTNASGEPFGEFSRTIMHKIALNSRFYYRIA